MSVQKELTDFSIVTNCPLVITPAETFLSYQTSYSASANKNVNGNSGECFPNPYGYLELKPVQKPPKCCSNNALIQNSKNVNYGMY